MDILSNSDLLKIIFAVSILILGIFLGRIVTYLLNKIIEKTEFNKRIRPSFIELIITLVRWSIYLVFISISLSRLDIPNITDFLSNILLTIPFFLGSIILIVLGFTIGKYLEGIVKEFNINEEEFLSKYLFYFVIFISGIYALKIALFSFKETISNYIILIVTIGFVAGIIWKFLKNKN